MANLAIRGYRQSRRLNCLAVLGINSQTEPNEDLSEFRSQGPVSRKSLKIQIHKA